MSHPWDDYRTGRMFRLEVREDEAGNIIDARVRTFDRAIKAYARSVAAERHGIPTDDVFLDAVTKRAQGWGVLRIWVWLTLRGRAVDLNQDRLWPWQVRKALQGGMPPSDAPTRRTGGTWTSDGPVTEPLWVADDKRAREGGQA